MKITKTADPEDLLRRINARLKEAIAKEKAERAQRNRENAQSSIDQAAGTDDSDLSSASSDGDAQDTRASGRAVRPPAPSARAEQNRLNAQKSTGPQTPEGKQRSSQNSLKHGFYADVEKLDPRDSPVYQDELAGLRLGLEPDGPAEEKLLRDLAMLSARLLRLEAVEFALLAGNLDGDPEDARDLAEAYRRAGPDLDRLHRSEVHLRRAFDRTWTRLERMQRERHKLPLNESLKRSQVWLTYESKRTNNPNLMPTRSMYIDEEGNPTQMNFAYDRPKPDAQPKKPASESSNPPKEDPKTA